MKKLLITLCLLACTFSTLADGQGKSVTVKQAKSLHDDSRVTLTGKITARANDDDKYWLEDSTGRIKVDIDDDDWEDENVAIGKTVRVTGDTDKDDDDHIEIDVDHIRVVE
ncbi:NirD/YgiW/YdeI family stress tolerance protein [Erwinia endophytica]|uniref:NirD/YgiW/YdeI family stress tolerance protein n=1 Tax=Erwinia endophytica TaxID=1563158 RepID=UPI001265E476|nr:NirD/YgiW/YdeI family stress tolerance protein [Erwinia endophytica]KAB8307510.1 NirD/YgiW/YdeI family stress tolerance protein [Erwinia endophytica]